MHNVLITPSVEREHSKRDNYLGCDKFSFTHAELFKQCRKDRIPICRKTCQNSSWGSSSPPSVQTPHSSNVVSEECLCVNPYKFRRQLGPKACGLVFPCQYFLATCRYQPLTIATTVSLSSNNEGRWMSCSRKTIASIYKQSRVPTTLLSIYSIQRLNTGE